ncbi:hypothetical protein [Streptomyces sp. TRM68416]|uniref:hypothetical protein n=1 Tax=Streptomyces sp. TRM68416 TaxID=2758412 RepID=UPI001661E7DC|nr:hypothetical protein [Streptomyces sp. TRM68416]MBD0837525.1 hypothetical protein [Streptomyces sp. TRM68416]
MGHEVLDERELCVVLFGRRGRCLHRGPQAYTSTLQPRPLLDRPALTTPGRVIRDLPHQQHSQP